MAITDWPHQDRPREKLLSRGAEALSDAELLAIFLRTGIQGCSAVDLARQLLNGFGSLRALLTASQPDFCAHKGLGNAKYAQLQAVLEMSNRHLQEELVRGDSITNPDDTVRYLQSQLRDRPHEIFACLMLDNRNRVIAFRELFRGTIDGANVYPREVVKQALADNAACVILAHNHPSGICEPSQADIQITERLKQALALVDIRVLDHVIVGEKPLCFSERGLL
ncbi:MAG: JAB domain-containing protein [Gammaproteobacteria bacterium]|nr:JAB domain-containing protein [Gammaproteobacteria bacterium]